MVDDRIGANLRRLRVGRGLSQAELAEAVESAGWSGVYPQTVLKIEQGSRSLKVSELGALSIALEIPVADLVDQLLLSAAADIDDVAVKDFEEAVAPLARSRMRLDREIESTQRSLDRLRDDLAHAKDATAAALLEWGKRHPKAAQRFLGMTQDAKSLGLYEADEQTPIGPRSSLREVEVMGPVEAGVREVDAHRQYKASKAAGKDTKASGAAKKSARRG